MATISFGRCCSRLALDWGAGSVTRSASVGLGAYTWCVACRVRGCRAWTDVEAMSTRISAVPAPRSDTGDLSNCCSHQPHRESSFVDGWTRRATRIITRWSEPPRIAPQMAPQTEQLSRVVGDRIRRHDDGGTQSFDRHDHLAHASPACQQYAVVRGAQRRSGSSYQSVIGT